MLIAMDWAILDRERNVQLYVGKEPPHLDGAFASAPRGTRYLGQLNAIEAHKAIGFELRKADQPVEVEITIETKRPRR